MFEYLNGVIKIKKPEYLAVDVNGEMCIRDRIKGLERKQ